jgi:hypothetical protein
MLLIIHMLLKGHFLLFYVYYCTTRFLFYYLIVIFTKIALSAIQLFLI